MIEYLYDAIRISSGGVETVTARVSDNEGNPITEGVMLMIHNDEELLLEIEGEYKDGTWYFPLSAKGLHGRYWYYICTDESELCFKQPIYFV